MWAEHALEAWSVLERGATRRSRGTLQVLDGPRHRHARLSLSVPTHAHTLEKLFP
jgi:hypothetical protein